MVPADQSGGEGCLYHHVEGSTLAVKRLAACRVRFIAAELPAWVQDGGGRRR